MSSRVAALAALVLCAVLVGWIATFAFTSQILELAGALTLLLAALVGVHLHMVHRSGDALNLLSLTGAFYLLGFFVGGIYVWLSLPGGRASPILVTISGAGLVAAVVLATVAWLCFAAGYLLDPFRLVRAIWRPPSRIVPTGRIMPLSVSMLAIGWAARLALISEGNYYHIHTTPVSPSAISWFVHTVSLLPLVTFAVVSAYALKPGGTARHRNGRALLAALLLVELAWAIPTGSREAIVTIFLVLVVVRYYTLRRLPSLKITIPTVVIFIFVIFPLIAAYRSSEFRDSPSKALLAAIEGQRPHAGSQTAGAGEATLARFGDVTALARILELGRNRMTFTTTDTISSSLEGLVPRALFPQKLDPGRVANEFGRSYGFLGPTDFITAIAVTQPGELYLGGGWLVLVLGMPILGALLRTLDEYLRARRWDRSVLALYAVTVPVVIVGLETSIAIGFVGAIKTTMLLGFVMAALGWTFSRGHLHGSSRVRPTST